MWSVFVVRSSFQSRSINIRGGGEGGYRADPVSIFLAITVSISHHKYIKQGGSFISRGCFWKFSKTLIRISPRCSLPRISLN
jgi:hypothetical protein